jgi:hypothetical protein
VLDADEAPEAQEPVCIQAFPPELAVEELDEALSVG